MQDSLNTQGLLSLVRTHQERRAGSEDLPSEFLAIYENLWTIQCHYRRNIGDKLRITIR
jgi:hypothetical protein